MSRFNDNNLENYQPVRERLALLFARFNDARVVTEIIKSEKFETIFKASIYRDYRDLKENLPLSTGYAQEFQDPDDFINDACFFENSETSAIGRALRNAGIGDFQVTKEEMVKTQVHHPFQESKKEKWDFPVKKSASESAPKPALKSASKPAPQEPQGIRVKGPTVSTDFSFKKINPKLTEDEIKNYQVPSGVHKGLYLDQIPFNELCEKITFLQNSPKQSQWVKDFLNHANQFKSLNT